MTTEYRHGADCFEILSFAGGSNDAKVYNVLHKATNEALSMYVIPKRGEEKRQCNPSLVVEAFNVPFAVNLRYSFQTKSKSYFLLDSVKEDRKLSLFQKVHRAFHAQEVVFIAAEILLAVSQLHAERKTYGFIDLEHVYLDSSGHVQLKRELRKAHFWLSRECIHCRQAGICSYHREASVKEEDLAKDWADLGKLIFILFGGNVNSGAVNYEKRVLQSCLPEDAASLLGVLLDWSANHYTLARIQSHGFFREVNWQKAQKCQLTPPDVFTRTPTQGSSRLDNLQTQISFTRDENQIEDQRLNGTSDLRRGAKYDGNATRCEKASITDQLASNDQRVVFGQPNDREICDDYKKDILVNQTAAKSTRQEGAVVKDDIATEILHSDRLLERRPDQYSDFGSNNHYFDRTTYSGFSKSVDSKALPDNIQQCNFERNGSIEKPDKAKRLEAEQDFDNITFVTVESLERSFQERSKQSEKSRKEAEQEFQQAGMSYREFNGQYQDLPNANKRYQRYSTGFFTDNGQGPLLSTLYTSLENILPPNSRYIVDQYGVYNRSISDDLTRAKLKQYDMLSNTAERPAFHSSRQYAAVGSYGDIKDNPSLEYELPSRIPSFTRSNSYQGGFQASSLGQRPVLEHGSSATEKSSDLLSNYPDSGWTNFSESSSVSIPSYAGKGLDKPMLNGDTTEQSRANDCIMSTLTSSDKRGQSLTTEIVQRPSTQFAGATNYSNQTTVSSWSSNDDKQFLEDYLNRSLHSEHGSEAEENVLRRTWPVGCNIPRPVMSGNSSERKHPSLVHRISDNDALQRIRQGAYLQARRDFHIPLKVDASAAKTESSGKDSTSFVAHGDSTRLSRSFDNEFQSVNEEVPILRRLEVDEIRPQSQRRAWASENRENLSFEDRESPYYAKYNTNQPGYSKLSSRTSERGLDSRPSYIPANIKDDFFSKEQRSYDSHSFSRSITHSQEDQAKRNSKKRNENLINGITDNNAAMNASALPASARAVVTENSAEPITPNDDDVFLNNDQNSCVPSEGGREGKENGNIANVLDEPGSDVYISKKKSADSGKMSHGTKLRRSKGVRVAKQKLRKCQSTGNILDEASEMSEDRIEDEAAKNPVKKSRRRENAKKSKSAEHAPTGSMVEENGSAKGEASNDRDNQEENRDRFAQRTKNQPDEQDSSVCESGLTEQCTETENQGKPATRSVSFHETTKTSGSSMKSPVTRKTKSAGAVDSHRLKSSLGKSMRNRDLNIEILPNPKSHNSNHRRIRSAEDELTVRHSEDVCSSPRKGIIDLNTVQNSDEGVGVTYLVDRLRVISEGGRRNSPSFDRRSVRNGSAFDSRQRFASENDKDKFYSSPNIVKPRITVQNSTPRSLSPAFDDKDEYDLQRKASGGNFVSRESSIGSASDLWLDEEEVSVVGRGISCRRSASASSAKSADSVEYLRARYSKSPTLTINSSEEESNNKEIDKQSCNSSSRSVDSGLYEDVFEPSKEDSFSLTSTARKGRGSAVSKSDSGVVKDINENCTNQSEQDIGEAAQEDVEPECLCHRCDNSQLDNAISKEQLIEICKKCHKKQIERKEAIVELIQTEINYGQDLRILKEEFYAPIKSGGILSNENVSAVFLNLQELIDVNSKLCITLQDDLEECITRDDQELESLQVGRVFLENVEFFQAYEVFCTKQRQASELVESLQKKSELLRIFLQVSCKQNSKLRKMDLKSFLTMPVQRIMKYPLLLTRIYRVTPRQNCDREALIQARRKIEEQITKINEIASGRPSKLRKSKSTSALNQTQSKGNHLLRLVAEILEWKLEETQIVLSDAFEVSCSEMINVVNWSRKSSKKPNKVQTLLCLYGVVEQLHLNVVGGQCAAGSRCEATNAAVIILKKKSTHRYSLFKEPIMLSQAVISEREDVKIAFEISPISKEPFTFIANDPMCSQKWLRTLRYYAKDLGIWRPRRNAMANIMIQSMS